MAEYKKKCKVFPLSQKSTAISWCRGISLKAEKNLPIFYWRRELEPLGFIKRSLGLCFLGFPQASWGRQKSPDVIIRKRIWFILTIIHSETAIGANEFLKPQTIIKTEKKTQLLASSIPTFGFRQKEMRGESRNPVEGNVTRLPSHFFSQPNQHHRSLWTVREPFLCMIQKKISSWTASGMHLLPLNTNCRVAMCTHIKVSCFLVVAIVLASHFSINRDHEKSEVIKVSRHLWWRTTSFWLTFSFVLMSL